jgi:deazaflavin-dependent oxidoreductase (nitroreductase family)
LKRTNPSSNLKKSRQEQYLYLTTQGRHSGLAREIEIWFTEQAGKFYVIAEHPDSHWLLNVRSHPIIQVRVGDERFQAHARLLSPDNDSQLHAEVSALSRSKYGWGDGTVVEIVPDPVLR